MPKGTAMRTASAILLLDDGELERPRAVLGELGADFVHLKGAEIGSAVALPRHLLVTSLRRAREIPPFEHPPGETLDPTWVCVADEDFRPLREQLRDLGIHYMVDAELDPESMRLFFLQLLGPGEGADAEERATSAQESVDERRTYPRREYRQKLWAVGAEDVAVVLGHDLSLTGIRVEGDPRLAVGDRVELALYGDAQEEPLTLKAMAVREGTDRGLALRFVNLTPPQTERLGAMLETLPPLESLQDDKPTGLVVSKLFHRSD